MSRVHNFSAGPATLPLEVLEKAQSELVDYKGLGSSVMEISHRSPAYSEIDALARERIKRILGIGDNYTVLFLQGGASTQFMMAPYNFLSNGQTADYIDTGRWSAKAITEAERFGTVNTAFSSKDDNYTHVPGQEDLQLTDDAQYVHFTSNNTVVGTQFPTEPETNGVPLICDASSDILSRSVDMEKYGMIYAGAQKNLGPAGVTVVIIRNDFLEKAKVDEVPTILRYKTHAAKIFNTPPVFAVYLLNLVLEWVEGKGGLPYFESFNTKKATLLYEQIDRDNFYRGTAEKASRSTMNVTFRLPSEELEKKFLEEAAKEKLVALKGHRSVGGIRASIYNACSYESVEALNQFMVDFRDKNG